MQILPSRQRVLQEKNLQNMYYDISKRHLDGVTEVAELLNAPQPVLYSLIKHQFDRFYGNLRDPELNCRNYWNCRLESKCLFKK